MEEPLIEENEALPPPKKNGYYMHIIMGLMVVAMIVLYFAEFIFIVVEAGHKGVLFDRLEGGTDTEKYLDEGFHIVFPWQTIVPYNTRVQEGEYEMTALTEDGLSVDVQVSYRYRPQIDSVGVLHKTLGPQYVKTILEPLVAAVTRNVVSHHHVDKLYSTSRNELQADMTNEVATQIHGAYPIDVIDMLIKNVALHPDVEQAIANKLIEEQKMLAYDFILEREKQEAQRKRVEGQGIRDFGDTTNIDYLQFRGLEATESLAKSPNSKVIVIGTGSGDLPIILGGN